MSAEEIEGMGSFEVEDGSNESVIKRYWKKYWEWRKKLKRRFASSSKLFYPNRPVLTVLIALGIIGLSFLGILPLPFALFLGANVMMDDVLVTPIMQIISDIRNLFQKRKTAKSIIHMVVIGLGFIVGALLGYFVFMSMPALVSLMPIIRGAIDTSITLFAIAGTGAVLLSKIIKVSPLLLMFFVGLMIIVLPIPMVFPIAVDIVAMSFLFGGFFAALAGKYGMKLIYKWRYKDSSADGFDFAHEKEELRVDHERADVFGIKVELAQKFRVALYNVIKKIKKISPYYTKITGSRKHTIGAYKDMWHVFMHASKDDPVSKEDVKKLINIDEQTDDSLAYYYTEPQKIVKEIYGKAHPVAGFFARLSAASGTYSKSEKGFKNKEKMHHFHAKYAKAMMFNKDKESMQVYEEFQEAANEFYTAAFK